MEIKIPVVHKQSSPPIMDCYSCSLRSTDGDGSIKCLMESIRHKWGDPGAEYYCADTFTKKFVNHFNKKLGKKDMDPDRVHHHERRFRSRRRKMNMINPALGVDLRVRPDRRAKPDTLH